MKLTTSQRRKIYYDAALFFENKKEIGGKSGFCDLGHDLDDFPEYLLFEPDGYMAYWFPTSMDGLPIQGERIIALLLCAEMCKP